MATFNTINKNRIVTITCSNSSGDWRGNLNRILGNNWSSTDKDLIGSKINDLTVKPNIELLMESTPSLQQLGFTEVKPLDDFFSKIEDSSLGNLMRKGINIGTGLYNKLYEGSDSNASVWSPWTRNIITSNTKDPSVVSFEYSFNFAMGQYGLWNAREEVAKPILNLMAPVLPRYLHNLTLEPAFPAAFDLLIQMGIDGFDSILDGWGNRGSDTGSTEGSTEDASSTDASSGILKGQNSLLDAVVGLAEDSVEFVMEKVQSISECILNAYNDYTYTLKFGNIYTFSNIAIINATPSFSNEVDQDGFPISGSIKLTFKGITPIALRSEEGLNALTLFN